MGSTVAALALLAAGQYTPPMQFDSARAWGHLLQQVSFGPRYAGTEGHAKCRTWLLEEMGRHLDNVRPQEFDHHWSHSGKKLRMANLLGELNWQNAKSRVVLLAHWDTRPFATEEPNLSDSRKPILGANDGASGVAVLLELMRVLKGRTGDVGIQFLLTDGEDLGPTLSEMFLGADHYARNLPNPKPTSGILLDMVGDKRLRIPVEPNSYDAAPALIQAFYSHAKAIGMQDTFPWTLGPALSDDHLPLIEAGIPTIDLIDFDYPAWHTLKDTPDQCSAESLGKVGRMMESFLLKKPPFKF